VSAKPSVENATTIAKTRVVHLIGVPRRVVEIAYLNWTSDQVMRQPKFAGLREDFAGLREDKAAREVRREAPK
jgi:ATP-dependent DNA ligase